MTINGYNGPVLEGDWLVLSCDVNMNVDLSTVVYRWTFRPNIEVKSKVVSKTSRHIIEKAVLGDQGVYECEASSVNGGASNQITVNILERSGVESLDQHVHGTRKPVMDNKLEPDGWHPNQQHQTTRKPGMDDKVRMEFYAVTSVMCGAWLILAGVVITIIRRACRRMKHEDEGQYI